MLKKQIWIAFIVLGLTLGYMGLAQGTTSELFWVREPVLGYDYDNDGVNIPATVGLPDAVNLQTTAGLVTVPWTLRSWEKSMTEFVIPRNTYSGSAVGISTDNAEYSYLAVYTFAGSSVKDSYSVTASGTVIGADYNGLVMLITGIENYMPQDMGWWIYTETWTNSAGEEITATKRYRVSGVPEPVSLLLLGCGLISLVGIKRKIK